MQFQAGGPRILVKKHNRMCPNHFSYKAEAGLVLVQAWQIVSMMFTSIPDRKILGFVHAPDIVLFYFLSTNIQIRFFYKCSAHGCSSVIYLPVIDRFCPRISVPYHTSYSGQLYMQTWTYKAAFLGTNLCHKRSICLIPVFFMFLEGGGELSVHLSVLPVVHKNSCYYRNL